MFPGFNTLQLSEEVKSLLYRLGETPEKFTGRILFMSMFNDISCGTKDNQEECLANARRVSLYARRFGKGQWSFIVSGSEKKWYSTKEDSPQGVWDNMAERMLLEFAESDCPIFRASTPLSRGQLKSKGHGKLSIHFAADQETIETIYRIIISANQLSLYGAVAEICEEYETLHVRTERPVMMGQSSSSLALSVIKTEVPLDCDDRANQNLLLQQYGARIEKLSQQDKLSKFCMDAGFLNVVENGQYFMTNDTGDLTQFNTVACREYTLPREDEASQPKGWIQGNTKIGPVVEGLSGWTWPRSSARPSFFLSVDRKDKADVLVLDRFLASLHRSQELLLVGRTAWAALWAVSKVVEKALSAWLVPRLPRAPSSSLCVCRF